MRIIQTSVDVTVKGIINRVHSSNNKNQEKLIYKRIINFVICDSCYWSASCLKLDKSLVTCPSCGYDDRLEFMPLIETEASIFDGDNKHGIILELSDGPKNTGRSS